MEFANTENKRYETEDGPIWASRSVAVCVIIETIDEKALITKRSSTMMDNPDEWCLVCGYIDRDETVHQAVMREIFEEVGLNVEGCECYMYGIGDSPHHNRQNITMHFVVSIPRTAEELDELIKIDPKEISEWAWVDDEYATEGMTDKVFAFNHGRRLQKLATLDTKQEGPTHETILKYNKGTHFGF